MKRQPDPDKIAHDHPAGTRPSIPQAPTPQDEGPKTLGAALAARPAKRRVRAPTERDKILIL